MRISTRIAEFFYGSKIPEKHELITSELAEELKKRIADKERIIRILEDENRNLKNQIGIKEIKEFEQGQKEKQQERIKVNLSMDANRILRLLKDKEMMNAKEVMLQIQCNKNRAWTIIYELERKGYVQIHGTTRSKYFTEKARPEPTKEQR